MAMVQHPMLLLAIFLVIHAILFNVAAHPKYGKLLKYVPPIVFAYFIPTFLTTLGILPDASPFYKWIKTFLLPFALFAFTMSLDLPTILKLGPKAIGMMLIGTFGIVLGGGVSLFVFKSWLPPDAWQGLVALAGSWIGGGANFVALGDAVGASPSILGPIIVVDVAVASVWMGLLIFGAGRKETFNRWFKADRSSIEVVQKKMENFQATVSKVATYPDILVILSLGFIATWLSYWLGNTLPPVTVTLKGEETALINSSTWRVIWVTTFGVLASFTKIRNYEGAGASKLGNVALYLLISVIGAQANLRAVVEYPFFILTGVLWILIHGVILLIGAKLLRAPLFFFAVGSQANVGGAASAPVVAAAFHPSLAPVGILLGILGYVLGNYVGVFFVIPLMRILGT